MIQSFKDLVVWKKSFDLVKKVYSVTLMLPESEKFGLTSQLQRSAVSIPSNISEGTKRGTRKDYVQFLRMTHGSSVELETQLLLIQTLYNIDTNNLLECTNEVQKMLYSLIDKLTPNT